MPWFDADTPADIRDYHRRSKHAPQRYARGPGFLDWSSQPDPFRRFEGCRKAPLPLHLDALAPAFPDLDRLGTMPPRLLDKDSLGLFLELGLGLSAWKSAGAEAWALRNNPSSGNLHPTEGYVILPALDGIGAHPAVYHYAPHDHELEERCVLDRFPALPEGTFLLGLSSIHWREAWKYGERAFRYCQHDVGHAFAALTYAAAILGWRVGLLAEASDDEAAALLGLDRDDDGFHPLEQEHPDLLAWVSPAPVDAVALDNLTGRWTGKANRLSQEHEDWSAILAATRHSLKPRLPAPSPWSGTAPALPCATALPAATVIRSRRSAMRMDGVTSLDRDGFFRILARCMPDPEAIPFAAFPWAPRIALALFVHRIDGLPPGLYLLARDPASFERLKAAIDPNTAWTAIDAPLPLYRLQEGDCSKLASQLSCTQSIAGHSAFSLGMIADFARTLDEEGDWAYRRLFWEAGMIGQVLYLEAVAAGVAGTGIGCYFDDAVHAILGLDPESLDWQSLYHFTIGGAVEDNRLLTLPPYGHLKR